MFTDLGKLIEIIQKAYDEICEKWCEQIDGDFINLKKKLVIDVREDVDVFNRIREYRELLNENMVTMMFLLNCFSNSESVVSSRVKTQNSIEYKIENYVKNHESGKIPIRKCINDLFGVRIVLNKSFSYDDIKMYMEEYYPQYKCIDSSKKDYIATHIYFQKGNLYFPWELQVWSAENEKRNYQSHRKYKQDYTRWEGTSKGGV